MHVLCDSFDLECGVSQAGYLDVFESPAGACNKIPMSKAQSGNPNLIGVLELCYTWNRVGKLSSYPLFGDIQ